MEKQHHPPPGWITAIPLEHYSSLNELSLLDLLGLHLPWPQKHFFIQFCLNLHSPLTIHPQAWLAMHVRDSALEPDNSQERCFAVTNINRWRLDISPYHSMEDYLARLIRWHKCNYTKSKKIFLNYGCTVSILENDWSEFAEEAYQLYGNVANAHGHWLYDRAFFQLAAKRPDYKMICAWYEGKMIAMFLLQDEPPTLHSIACGLDYHHSTASYAYSWLHYDLIKAAIEKGIYRQIDVGLTADESKRMIGFNPINSTMDVYSQGRVTRYALKAISKWVRATITSGAKLQFEFKRKNS